MIGIELDATRRPDIGSLVTKAGLAKGVIVLPAGIHGNVISLTPALTITGRQLEWALNTFRDVLVTHSG
jgi:4-aminobutyrate aminotransferase-like enzyme